MGASALRQQSGSSACNAVFRFSSPAPNRFPPDRADRLVGQGRRWHTLQFMPKGQNRVYGTGQLHFITCRCYLGQPKLGVEKHRDLFVQLLEELRVKFRFKVAGYAVMPSHFDLLMTEPGVDTAENAINMLRKRYGRRYNTSARSDEQVWETRYADTHVFDPERVQERLAFMHQEPVKAGLAETSTDWLWSSARAYAGMEEGVVTVDCMENKATAAGRSPGKAAS
ncbi:MAG TPA: hypothetical protein VGR96_02075 [Acidobacteriaceae bacterium]|nr:hypothetical protein [Acidobacteriaceae bacterium]